MLVKLTISGQFHQCFTRRFLQNFGAKNYKAETQLEKAAHAIGSHTKKAHVKC